MTAIHLAARQLPSVDVELFAGAGGLALGLGHAGVFPAHLLERERQCCETLRLNAKSFPGSLVHEEDVSSVDWSRIERPVRILSGGPPCQPFSVAGRLLADQDGRNQFPSTMRAIRALRPAVVLLENVPGIARPGCEPYVGYILRQLTCPAIGPRDGERWEQHDARLRREARAASGAAEYRVVMWVLNAANYGVAQARVRVVFVASRLELPAIDMPRPTHSRAALIATQRSGEYWGRRGLPRKRRKDWPKRLSAGSLELGDELQPWCTVRDALAGLPEPSRDETAFGHWRIPGARLYDGHSGSELDWPAKTIKAGVHGVAGGENVLLLGRGRHRYFTLREMARLQGFPDHYRFAGPRSRVIAQIGNAVPVEFARIIAAAVTPAAVAFDRMVGLTRRKTG